MHTRVEEIKLTRSPNPTIDASCAKLQLGWSYCVQVNNGTGPTPTINPKATLTGDDGDTDSDVVPTPTQSGQPSTCVDWYYVRSNDTCQGIVDYYRGLFSLSDFFSWNPDVGTSCENLLAGYFVCTGLSSTPTELPETSATPPQPEQTGVISNCESPSAISMILPWLRRRRHSVASRCSQRHLLRHHPGIRQPDSAAVLRI